MRKIPTLFARARGHAGPVTPDINPDVVSWLGYAAPETLIWSRKVDGTCTMFDGTDWFGRREIKPGQATPADFVLAEEDTNTGSKFGWVPIVGGQFEKFHAEALANLMADAGTDFPKGTYELVGPKINGNPEGIERHVLVHHNALYLPHEQQGLTPTYTAVRDYLEAANKGDAYFEGLILTHTGSGRRAKIKLKDYTAK